MPQDGKGEVDLEAESAYLKELQTQKDDLMASVGSLRTELQDWRRRLDAQVHTYKAEVVKLRAELSSEVDAIKGEFAELRAALRQQLDLSAVLGQEAQAATMPPDATPKWP